MNQIEKTIREIIRFIYKDIWRIRLRDLSGARAYLIKTLRIILISIRGFNEDRCSLRASALTFYSLLSVVPVVAMVFAVAKGFGFENYFEKELLQKFPEHQTVVVQIINYAQTLLEQTKGGVIAGAGVVFLIWAVIKVLSNIELTFNDIWNLKKQRNFVRKLTDYLSIILISPVFFILSSGATVYIKSQVTNLTQNMEQLQVISPFFYFVLNLFPYLMVWILFTFIYIVMPNTRVRFVAGVTAAVVAGTIYQLTQWIYISFQVGVSRYNAIYGSLAALPLFLIWMQLSWMIVLLGAEIAFAVQNADTFEFEYDSHKISPYHKRLLSLLIAHLVVKKFAGGKSPLTAAEIGNILGIPIRLVRQVLYEFVQSRIFSTVVVNDEQDLAYQPAGDICRYSIGYVINKLENSGSNNIPVPETGVLKTLEGTLHTFARQIEKSPENKLLKDI